MSERLEWTSSPPDSPGWWWRETTLSPDAGSRVVRDCIHVTTWDIENGTWDGTDCGRDQMRWAGPISAPATMPGPHFTSARTGTGSDAWETPADVFDWLDYTFKFDLDAAADAGNARLPRWLGPGSPLGEDALTAGPWPGERIFLNPPYSQLTPFLYMAAEQAARGKTVVVLMPARTDTRAWHDIVMPLAREVWFIRGRLRFTNSKNTAPFPSCVVVFDHAVQLSRRPSFSALDPAAFPGGKRR